MKLRVGIALLGVLAVPLVVDGENVPGKPPTAEQKENARRIVMKMLSEQKLPKVEFERTKVRDALGFFGMKTHRFNMACALGDSPEPRITIHRRDMPLTEFLDEVCKQSGLKWMIEYPGLIRITPKT